MAEIFTNMARSRLASSITDVATTLTVLTGDGNLLFPAAGSGDYFRFVLYNLTTGNVEICTCTSRTGDVLTISRAQEDIGNVSATAYAFNANDIIEHRPTSAFFDSLSVTSTNIQRESFNYGADSSGTPNDIAVALSPTVTTLTAGLRVSVKVANTTTGATTLTVDGTAATAVKKYSTQAIEAGDLNAGGIYSFVYDGTNFQLSTPTDLGLGTASVEDIGTSGNTVPKNNAANIFSDSQSISTGAAGAFLFLKTNTSVASGVGNFINANMRWLSGADSSGDWVLERHDSAGGLQDEPITVLASTGAAYLKRLIVGAPYLDDKGAGTINAEAVYEEGVKVISVGAGQTWQDVKGVGAHTIGGGNNTPSTTRSTMVNITWEKNTSAVGLSITVGGVVIAQPYDGSSVASRNDISFVVPPNTAYSVSATSGSPTISIWVELK